MDEHRDEHGAYIRQVGERTRRYAREILEENERLRALIAALRTDEERAREEIEAARALSREVVVLREQLLESKSENERLTVELEAARDALTAHEREHERLRRQLDTVDADNRCFTEQFVALEQQNNNLANLYVASYRLHETLDHDEVVQTLQEILANLVGTEEMALFEMSGDGGTLSLSASNGIQPEIYRTIPVGVGRIGRVAATGEAYTAGDGSQGESAPGEEHLTACIPLKLAGRVTGVLAVFRLLPQKSGLEPLDRELFDLLASQAAMALYSTTLHSRARQD
ncbi:MAG: GAF domain-containing protein [Vicinamibacteria bacterium]|nr:GAF domain-containing protein [Vicinamibacteria bacterium]